MAPANNLKRVVRLTVLFMLAWVGSAAWASNADAFESFYDDNCISCHDSGPAARTCAGCHAHGVHPDSVKDTLNVTAVPDRRSYSPGDFINVEIGGGYLDGWVRTQVWDLDCDIPGTCSQGNARVSEKGTSTNSPGPVTLTATVPTAPGDYTWYAGRYGNDYDEAGAAFGEFPDSASGSNLWIPDAENWGHGNEVVTFSFTVVAKP